MDDAGNSAGNTPQPLESLKPGSAVARFRRERRVRDRFWRTVRRAARRIPFIEEVVAAYYCAFDPNTPHRVRGVLIAALAYFVLPLDGIPDFLAFVGFSDDLTVLAAVLAAMRRHISPAHRASAREALAERADDGVYLVR